MLNVLYLLGILCLSLNAFAMRTVTEKAADGGKELDLQYPLGFSRVKINDAVLQMIAQSKSEFRRQLQNDKTVPDNVPGKSSLIARYHIDYQQGKWLSIRMNFAIFPRGAAHPNHWIRTLNFYDGNLLSLETLFQNQQQGLNQLADYCQKQLMKNEWAEADWVKEGTRPVKDNYLNWTFHDKGLAVIFDTYQVTAYVYGPQTVMVPFSVFLQELTSQYQHHHWGNQ